MAGVRARSEDGLFAYGSLQFPEVQAALLRRQPPMVAATALGWRAAPLVGRPYPGLVRDPGAEAAGMLLSRLSVPEWELLDAFEGEFYRVELVDVGTGPAAHSYTWVVPAEVRAGTWDRRRFAERHLAGFVAGCRAWRRWYDANGRG